MDSRRFSKIRREGIREKLEDLCLDRIYKLWYNQKLRNRALTQKFSDFFWISEW